MISSNKGALTLKYQLLNPSDAFADFASARSVVIAGGTMAPLSDFAQQLFTFHGAERIRNLSCSHVVAQDHILVRAVGVGPTGARLEFKYESRGDVKMLDEYGSVISNVANVTHKGVVVFMPSYATLDLLLQRWETTGTLAKIRQKKEVYQEPKTGSESDAVLRDFAAAIAGSGVSASASGRELH
jgi:chromosome transmission fidelity protein 1